MRSSRARLFPFVGRIRTGPIRIKRLRRFGLESEAVAAPEQYRTLAHLLPNTHLAAPDQFQQRQEGCDHERPIRKVGEERCKLDSWAVAEHRQDLGDTLRDG